MNSFEIQNNSIDEVQLRIRLYREKYEVSLDLSDLGLKKLPDEIKELKNIEYLNLSENSLTELPDFIGTFSNLEYLDLSYNRLYELPAEIEKLAAIETLKLRCNEIKEIPKSIGKLTMLNTLDISYNHLSSLPETINNLIHLKHCNIKGNNLKTIPSKITELIMPKNYSFFGHIENIVELTGKNGLSDDFILTAKHHIDYISQRLNITPIQTVLFSHIVSKFDDDAVQMNEIASSLNCKRIKVMQYIDDFEELEKKKLIRSRKLKHRAWGPNDGTSSYYIPKEVITALIKNIEYKPIDQSNLSIDELFIRIEVLFTQRIGDEEIDYQELSTEIIELLNDNNQLPFVRKVYDYGLAQDNLMILVRFCHHYFNFDNAEMGLNEISRIFDRHTSFIRHKQQFKNGEHVLITQGFIEHTNSEGFADRESFKLTDKTKNELLSDIKIKKSRNRKDLIRSETIQEKILFYNEKEKEMTFRLLSILDEPSFKQVQARLSESGMRTGFACLFSGLPGTGKS
jgi:Leucine-rich repeat (LRR) protein